MKRIMVFAAMAAVGVAGVAAEVPDSVTELDEVAVEARMRRTSTEGSVYIPTERERSAAQNVMELLNLVGMQQVRINPADGSVTTPTGAGVAVFINCSPATPAEIEGTLSADVSKVEYLDHPTDPRFRGAAHVVNFTVRKYEYGGYTKVSATESVLTGLASKASVYSRFNYGRVSWDLYVGAENTDCKGLNGDAATGLYTFDTGKVERREQLAGSRLVRGSYPLSLRAVYAHGNARVSNTLEFSHSSTPRNDRHGSLAFTPGMAGGYDYTQTGSSRSNSVAWIGDCYLTLPGDCGLNVTAAAEYSRIREQTDYASTLPAAITNAAAEDAGDAILRASIRKMFGERHGLVVNLFGELRGNGIDYTGTSPSRQEFLNPVAGGYAGYTLCLDKFSFVGSLGWFYERVKINDSHLDHSYPTVMVSGTYSPDERHSVEVELGYDTRTPDINAKSPNTLRQNELMSYSGNPGLKNWGELTASAAYTWMPSNAFSAMVYGKYTDVSDRMVAAYAPDKSTGTMLRTYINGGSLRSGQAGVALTWRPLGGALSLSASPAINFYKSTGYYNDSRSPFSFEASAAYYLRNFYFMADFRLRTTHPVENSGAWSRDRNWYSLSAGWSNTKLNVRLSLVNIGRGDWTTGTSGLSSPSYSEHLTSYGAAFHRRIGLSVTYSIGYGKKVRRDNELGEQSLPSSAILK